MKKAMAAAVLLAAGGLGAAGAEESLQERLERLEQKQAAFDRKWEHVRVGGILQGDARFVLGDESKAYADAFTLAKARPIVEGAVHEYVDFKLMPDFGAGTSVVQDAYLDLKYVPAARLRVGKFKVPLGLERLQSDTVLLFIERGFTAALLPNRDVGAQVSGEFGGGQVSYQAGVFNGGVDAASVDTDVNDDKELMARVFFARGDAGAGAAWSRGTVQGTPAAPALPSYRSNAPQTFLAYRADTLADGARVRLTPQAYWYPGRWSFLTEYASSSQEVKRGTTTLAATTFGTFTNTAWQVAVGCVLTGEKTSYKGVKPGKPFDPAAGTWGALELAARYSEFTADRDDFATFANPATAARRARLLSGGANWYLNAGVKLTTNYDYTRFTRGAAAGDRADERALLTRLQLVF